MGTEDATSDDALLLGALYGQNRTVRRYRRIAGQDKQSRHRHSRSFEQIPVGYDPDGQTLLPRYAFRSGTRTTRRHTDQTRPIDSRRYTENKRHRQKRRSIRRRLGGGYADGKKRRSCSGRDYLGLPPTHRTGSREPTIYSR